VSVPRYNVFELEEWLAPDAEESTAPAQFTMPVETVGPGDRNLLLFRLGRALVGKGLTPPAILAAMRAENAAKCAPPHDDAEVERVFQRVLVQPDRPFARPAESSMNGNAQAGDATEDPMREALEADAPDDPAAIRLTEARAQALVAQVTYADLTPLTDVAVANWVARWFGHGLRFADVEDVPRWFTGTHWADDAARGRFGQCVRLTTRFLYASAAGVPIPADVLTATTHALEEKARREKASLSRETATVRAEAAIRQSLAKGLLA